MNRRSLKVSQRYGVGIRNHENDTRDNMLTAEEKFKEIYKTLDSDQKKRVDYNSGLEQARATANKAKKMTFLDEASMLVKNSGDKRMSTTDFIRCLKESLHPNLVFIPNMTIGENVGGNSIYFNSPEGMEFICGIGKNMAQYIDPETEFQDVNDGTKVERKIKSRGYLAAVQVIVGWLDKHQIVIRNRNFLN